MSVRPLCRNLTRDLCAQSINPSTPSLFKAKQSPLTVGYKPKPGEVIPQDDDLETSPKKLQWTLTPDLRAGIRFAETRISDLICQNDSQALEFTGYGKNFITRHGFSPDAFVQMAFQAAYYGLYGACDVGRYGIQSADVLTLGRVESTYEPAMTKGFLHGRTEAVRTVQPESVNFVKVCVALYPCRYTVLRNAAFRIDVLLGRPYSRREDSGSTGRVQAPHFSDQGVQSGTGSGQVSGCWGDEEST